MNKIFYFILTVLAGSVSPAFGDNVFDGVWVNDDSQTRGITKIVIDTTSGESGAMITLASCFPQDCNWGATSLSDEDERLTARYIQEHKIIDLSLEFVYPESLQVREVDTYFSIDGKQTTTEYLLRLDKQSKTHKIPRVMEK